MKALISSLVLVGSIASANQEDAIREQYVENISETYVQLVIQQAEARQAGVICEYYKSVILEHVQTLMGQAYQEPLRSNLIQKLKASEAVSQEMGDSLTYRAAIDMVDANNSYRGLETALPGVTLFGPAPGVYGNTSYVTFIDQDTVELGTLALGDDAMNPHWEKRQTQYQIERADREVFLVIDGTKYLLSSYVQSGEIFAPWNQQWNLVPADQPEANPHHEGYVDLASECEA